MRPEEGFVKATWGERTARSLRHMLAPQAGAPLCASTLWAGLSLLRYGCQSKPHGDFYEWKWAVALKNWASGAIYF
jgi:hypothetical protein